MPTFSKIDCVFTSPDWNSSFPSITLSALEVTISDHAPFLLTCKHLNIIKQPMRMEKFWFQFHDFKAIVRNNWHNDEYDQFHMDSQRYEAKLEALQRPRVSGTNLTMGS